LLSGVCTSIGPRRRVLTFISRNWSKPPNVRFWSPF
jgi:hypothetical protein